MCSFELTSWPFAGTFCSLLENDLLKVDRNEKKEVPTKFKWLSWAVISRPMCNITFDASYKCFLKPILSDETCLVKFLMTTSTTILQLMPYLAQQECTTNFNNLMGLGITHILIISLWGHSNHVLLLRNLGLSNFWRTKYDTK